MTLKDTAERDPVVTLIARGIASTTGFSLTCQVCLCHDSVNRPIGQMTERIAP